MGAGMSKQKEHPDTTTMRTFAIEDASREWALYRKTKNGAHAWDAYIVYRGLIKEGERITGNKDNWLPPEFLKFFDECAAQLKKADPKKPQDIKRALQMAPTTKKLASRAGGPSGFTHANATKKQRDIVEFVVLERNEAARTKKDRGDLYSLAARKYGTTKQQVAQLMHAWGASKKRKKT